MNYYLRVILVGLYFGIVLVKSQVAEWNRIHDMFLFREPYMYLVITSAIVVAGISMWIIKRNHGKSVDGETIVYTPKPYHKGILIGGAIFGMGWAITGACPGPMYVQIGAGAWPALFSFGGAMIGMYIYAALRPRLPH